jgi:predicted nucleotidyltransferase component of viral defense system
VIERREILDVAGELGLQPQVVEKDYVLGWLLAGIYNQADLKATWVFKGGTCLKKCYLETYRFSEDLDFTLTDESHLDVAFLKSAFAEVSTWSTTRQASRSLRSSCGSTCFGIPATD